MINTNGLSPLMQAAVGGETKSIAGQYITKTEDGFMYDSGQRKIPVHDPDNVLEMNEEGLIVDNDYMIEETEAGIVIKSILDPSAEEAPGMPAQPSGQGMGEPMGGVGPMNMASPYKNYKNPQDYKVFNFGNKPTPFNKHKKGKY